ncbi:MAG TPA: hypothetical protein VGZ00_04225 [Candidatus Baltobacteraceae bacterium]|jgi:hypothetical protein|nr:hypothetical protein [Candidatus Baltobacteraceae bacterium]
MDDAYLALKGCILGYEKRAQPMKLPAHIDPTDARGKGFIPTAPQRHW